MKMQKMFMGLVVLPLLVVGTAQCDNHAKSLLNSVKHVSNNTAAIMPVWATRIVKWFDPSDEQCAVIKRAADACGNLFAKGAVKFSHPELSSSEQVTLLSLLSRRASVLEFLDMAAAVTSPMAKIAFLRHAVNAQDLFELGASDVALEIAWTKRDAPSALPYYAWKACRAMVALLDVLGHCSNDLHCLNAALKTMNHFVSRVNEFNAVSTFALWPEELHYSGRDLGRGHQLLPLCAKTALLACNSDLRLQGLTCFQLMLKRGVGVDAAIEALKAMDKADFYRRELENSLITTIRAALKTDKQSEIWAMKTLTDLVPFLSDLKIVREVFNNLPNDADAEAIARLKEELIDEEDNRTPWYRRSIDTW